MPAGAAMMTANEAASVTGVPLRQVHRLIDAGLLEGAVKRRNRARFLARKALVGLKIAHDTADLLTLESRRGVVAASIRHPRQTIIHADPVFVDARPAAKAVRSGLDQLARAQRMVSSESGVLGGAATFKGTRIVVHDVADMLANEDTPASIARAYPQLDLDRIRLSAVYATAYPRRGRPRRRPAQPPKISQMLRFDELPAA